MRNICSFLFFVLITTAAIGQEDTTQVKELGEVVITGQYKPQSVRNSVYQVRVINNEQIRLSGAVSVQQVLTNQLGFRFTNDNTLGTADVQFMGMGGRNVKILLDGVPLADRGDTRESLGQVDINTIEKIEIVEGPLSVSYGSDALAGIINIITKRSTVNSLSVFAKAQEETAGKEYYPFSYKGVHAQSAGVTWNRKKWNTSFGGTHNESDGFGGDVYGRNKNWKPKEQWLGNIRTGYATTLFNIYYRLDALSESISSRGAINMDTYKAIDRVFHSERTTHQVQSGWNLRNNLQVNSIIGYTDYSRKTTTTRHDFEKNTDELTTGAAEQDLSTFNSFIFRTTLHYKISSSWSIQPGIDINREAARGARIAGSPVITDYAVFISSEIKPTEKINIRPGLRFIKNTVYDAPPVIPSVNTKFILSKVLDLRLAYGYGFRSPALRELYFDFHDTNHDIVGNPDLKAEHSNSFSGSLTHTPIRKGKISFVSTTGIFYNEFRNLINYALNPAIPNQYIAVNIDKFKTAGATLETKLEVKDLKATLGFSYTGRFNNLSDAPAYTAENLPVFTWSPEINSTVIWSVKEISTTVGLFYKYTGPRPGYQLFFNNNTGQEEVGLSKISSFHWADLTITKKMSGYLTATGGIKNILDVTDLGTTSAGSGSVHGSAGPVPVGYGRSFFLGVSFQWDKK
ncbi:MAG: TonB-dependent receptor [Ferruginibacter sp.]|nr:TonB-dependent receptor [Chitinophagaceae bacterium]